MKPLSLNLSQMSKVAGDKHSSTFRHAKGHEIKVLHTAIPALYRKQVMELPVSKQDNEQNAAPEQKSKEKKAPEVRPDKGYGKIIFVGAEGGKVEAHDEEQDAYPDNATEEQHQAWLERVKKKNDALHHMFMKNHAEIMKLACGGKVKMYADSDEPVSKEDSAPTVEINNVPAQPQQQAAPFFNSDAPAAPPQSATDIQMSEAANNPEVPKVSQGVNPLNRDKSVNPAAVNANAQAANAAIRDVSIAQGKAAADQQIGYLKAIQEHQRSFDQTLNNYKKHVDDTAKWIAENGAIDPKHYANSLSTGSKVATAIGLFLGGMGASTTGSNAAMDFLNRQIDRDIDAQKERVGQQKTILGAYQHLFGDNLAAYNATKATLLDNLDHQGKLTAAKLGTPIAQARYLQMNNDIALEKQKLLKEGAVDLHALPGYQKVESAEAAPMAPAAAPSGSGRGAAAPSRDGGGARTVKASKEPDKKGFDYEAEHILSPNANASYTASQYRPEYKDDSVEVQKQLEGSALTDKAIDAINHHFPAMYANVKRPAFEPANSTGTSKAIAKVANIGADAASYLHKKGANFEDVPFIGKAVSGLAKTVTDTQSNREYDVHRDAMLSSMTAALAQSGMTPTEAHSTAIDFLPVEGDTPEMARLKINAAKEKLKNVTRTNALERHGLTRKKKK